jgi:hypothetical protein
MEESKRLGVPTYRENVDGRLCCEGPGLLHMLLCWFDGPEANVCCFWCAYGDSGPQLWSLLTRQDVVENAACHQGLHPAP